MESLKFIIMKNFKKRKYNALDGSFLKNHDVSKKHKAKNLAYENQLPIDWHEVKIILDATVVEKYLNNRKSGGTISPSHREKILVQKIPRLNQNVFSEKSNVMVKLEIPEEFGVGDNLSPKDSLIFDDVPVKQEDGILLLDSLDKNTFYNGKFIEPLPEDFQCQDRDNFMVETALKKEVVESECCYEETIIGQEFKDALKNEELFVGEEFKHEESVRSYENVESIDQEDNEEIIKKKTRSSRKKKKCLDCIDCSHRLAKKPRPHLLNKVVPSKLSIQKPSKSKSSLRGKEKKTNQESLHIAFPEIPNPQKANYRGCYYCAHCIYRGRCREYLIKHLRKKHPYLFSKKHQSRKSQYRVHHCDHCKYKGLRREYLIRHLKNKHPHLFSTKPDEYRVYHCDHCNFEGWRDTLINHLRKNHAFLHDLRCLNCGDEFNSDEDMLRHRAVCLLYLICKFCLVDVPTKMAMVKHMKSMHPEKIYVEDVSRYSMEDGTKTLDPTPFGQRYMEIEKFYMEIKSELIKLYCPKCAVTNDKIISRIAPRCDNCKSRLLYQCQKCKDTRNYYAHIWRHLKSKNSYCSIYGDSSFIGHEESSDVIVQASSNEMTKRHDCEICDFKGTTRTKLYEHVLSLHLDDGMISNGYHTCSKCGASFRFENTRFKNHQELCGIAGRFPCRLCPMTCSSTRYLSDHFAIVHFDELDGKDIEEFVKEASDFRKMVKVVNTVRFNDKLRNGTTETDKNYYHNGIESLLKPVCIKCKTDGPHDREHCAKCQVSLSFVCLKCDELFSKYSDAWDHVTRICENRSFTLTVGKTHKIFDGDVSTKNKRLLYCEHCSFKNASKPILCNHIKYAHPNSHEINGHFTCSRCYRSFGNSAHLRQHKLRCRVGFLYTCPFCDKTLSNFHVIESHITAIHTNHFRCKDTLDEILQRVIENKRARTKKTNNRFDEFGRIIRRTFSENVKLAAFFCPKCDETVHKNFRSAADTRTCPKCNGELHVCCKICNRDYFTWRPMNTHFQIKECGAVEIGTYDLDHSYSRRQ